MFWKRRGGGAPRRRPRVSGPLAERTGVPAGTSLTDTVRLERGLSRAAAISRIADELKRRGEEIVELFKEVSSPEGRAVLPIYLRRNEEDVFVEVQTDAWEKRTVDDVLRAAAVLRASEYSGAVLEVLGAYPVPEEVRFLGGHSPAALLQLDLFLRDDPREAETCAEGFRGAAERHWGMKPGYEPEGLPLIEALLKAAIHDAGDGQLPPILDALVRGYGCYAGEILRRHAAQPGSWCTSVDWGEGPVLEFRGATADPVGKARAFLENGPDDSVAYYVSYAMSELNS